MYRRVLVRFALVVTMIFVSFSLAYAASVNYVKASDTNKCATLSNYQSGVRQDSGWKAHTSDHSDPNDVDFYVKYKLKNTKNFSHVCLNSDAWFYVVTVGTRTSIGYDANSSTIVTVWYGGSTFYKTGLGSWFQRLILIGADAKEKV